MDQVCVKDTSATQKRQKKYLKWLYPIVQEKISSRQEIPGLLWEGNLYFASRIKDLIIIRGRNYYPHDFENALTEIKELRAGCIVAYPTIDQDRAEALAIAMEIQKNLLKDARVFKNISCLPLIKK